MSTPLFNTIFCTLFLTSICHAQEPVVGIGALLSMQGEKLTVTRVLPKTPAAEAGITEGLVIVMVDGMFTPGKTMHECVEKIRGLSGTKVKLELVDPKTGKGRTLELTRRVLQVSQ